MATGTTQYPRGGARVSLDHPGWICHERGSVGIDRFLKRNKPSQVTDPGMFWVYVSNPERSQRTSVDYSCVQRTWNEFTHTNQNITPDDVRVVQEKLERSLDPLRETLHTSMASASGYTSGKWLIYRKHSLVDDVWEAVARAVTEGKLGPAAKVSSRSSSQVQSGQQHVICVYTEDYTDEADVFRVETTLRELGITGRLSYKPDIYTACGIYYRNPWNLKPTVFSTNR